MQAWIERAMDTGILRKKVNEAELNKISVINNTINNLPSNKSIAF
ncbi:hypothetical protein [Candidatus Doolittlea endobia]